MKRSLLFILLAFTSCSTFNLMNGSNPNKNSFAYYDKSFKLNISSNLKMNRKYIRTVSHGIDMLIFFDDGFLNNYYTDSLNGRSTSRSESGDIMGYYKLENDSIFFTTKSYYQHRPTNYRGLIKEDTLYLEVKYPKNNKVVKEKYILY